MELVVDAQIPRPVHASEVAVGVLAELAVVAAERDDIGHVKDVGPPEIRAQVFKAIVVAAAVVSTAVVAATVASSAPAWLETAEAASMRQLGGVVRAVVRRTAWTDVDVLR